MDKIFFQSSLPRAGSTLLQNIMGQNPDFYVTPTSGVLELIFSSRVQYTESPEFKAQDSQKMENGFIGFCREGMKGFYNAITDKKYILDKSRGWGIHYDFLNKLFPQPKIVVMVRDIRDIFTSMEMKFRANPLKHNNVVNWSELKGTTVPKRIDVWANTPPIGIAVERISDMMRMGIDKKVLFIKYEELCLYPDEIMKRIYDYFELPYYTGHNFDSIEQTTKEDDQVYGIYGDHKIKNKLELAPPRHNEILGKDVSDWIYNNYRWFFDYFGYSV